MDIAKLVVEYFRVLAWPLVACTAFLMFRAPITRMIDRVIEAKALGATVRLAEQAAAVAAEAQLLPELLPSPTENSELANQHHGVDETVLGRLMTAWKDLEAGTRELAVQTGRGGKALYNVAATVQSLARAGVLSEDSIRVARDLQGIRNMFVHDLGPQDVTVEVADDFLKATTDLRRAVQVALDRQDS